MILTFNEEKRVGRCLRSLKGVADRVVVLDSFSSDATLAIVRKTWIEELGLSPDSLIVVSQTWKGFTVARNNSLAYVTSDWVLWIDADEWLSEGLQRELRYFCIQNPSEWGDVFRMPRLSLFLGREIRHGGWYPDRKARLARARHCEWKIGPNGSDVHEDLWPLSGTERPLLKNALGHEPFLSEQEQFDTNDRYSTLLAQGLARKWRSMSRVAPSNLKIAVKVIFKFFENYIWKLGFLDGRPGFLIAKGSAESLSMRLRKARALLISEGVDKP